MTEFAFLHIVYLYLILIQQGEVITLDSDIKDIIRRRRSVRTYNGEVLRPDDKQKLSEFLRMVENPFGIPIEFRLLDAKEYGLTSPVIIRANEYVAAKVSQVQQSEIAFGYSFEKFCLFAESIGIGTVMLAATINRSAFEKAMNLKPTEVMPVASPVGYPADKQSIREVLMRKTIKADERLPFDVIFFENSFSQSLQLGHAGMFQDALEMTRLAPSAGNKQPWRVVVCGNKVHFYEKKTLAMSKNALIDIQKVDIGIALSHFDLTMKESGVTGSFAINNPGLEKDEQTEYIVTYEVMR